MHSRRRCPRGCTGSTSSTAIDEYEFLVTFTGTNVLHVLQPWMSSLMWQPWCELVGHAAPVLIYFFRFRRSIISITHTRAIPVADCCVMLLRLREGARRCGKQSRATPRHAVTCPAASSRWPGGSGGASSTWGEKGVRLAFSTPIIPY